MFPALKYADIWPWIAQKHDVLSNSNAISFCSAFASIWEFLSGSDPAVHPTLDLRPLRWLHGSRCQTSGHPQLWHQPGHPAEHAESHAHPGWGEPDAEFWLWSFRRRWNGCRMMLFVFLPPAVKESLNEADMQTRREPISAEPRQKLRIFYQVTGRPTSTPDVFSLTQTHLIFCFLCLFFFFLCSSSTTTTRGSRRRPGTTSTAPGARWTAGSCTVCWSTSSCRTPASSSTTWWEQMSRKKPEFKYEGFLEAFKCFTSDQPLLLVFILFCMKESS